MPDLNFTTPFAPFSPRSSRFINLTGRKFGRLSVISLYGKDRKQGTLWLTYCKCGHWQLHRTDGLLCRPLRSCKHCSRTVTPQGHTTHGEATGSKRSPEFQAYHHAKGRCQNPKNRAYADYGGRGIEFRFQTVADFLQAVGRRPSPAHSLDRIDNDGHYEPGNIRWASQTTQTRNQRKNLYYTINGVTKCISEWAKTSHIKEPTIRHRLRKGWSIEDALTIPVQ